MFWFLGIVKQQNMAAGRFIPDYILCRSHSESPARAPWRVCRTNGSLRDMPKVLVTQVVDQDLLIDFMSRYRTRDHVHNSKKYRHDKTKKYYPVGGLFWFPCDDRGVQNGPALFIKKIPDKSIKKADDGLHRLQEALINYDPTIPDILKRERSSLDMESMQKPKLFKLRYVNEKTWLLKEWAERKRNAEQQEQLLQDPERDQCE